jgi:hypothetical protein
MKLQFLFIPILIVFKSTLFLWKTHLILIADLFTVSMECEPLITWALLYVLFQLSTMTEYRTTMISCYMNICI